MPNTFDAVVVGSGASGGWAAKQLTEAGLTVALVDAGRPHTEADFREHTPAFSLRYRNMAPGIVRRTRPRQSECYACTEHNYDWFANDIEEPYTTPEGKPFSWQGRMRITGGRTNVWARQSYRFSDLDFKAASFDGWGVDWPLGYDDLAPVLQSRRGLRRHQRSGRRRVPAARWPLSSADAADVPRDAHA